MNNEMGEMHNRITPMDLAAEMQVSPERVGQLFRALRDGKHPHFAGRFNRFAELNPIQVSVLRGEDLTVVDVVDIDETKSAAPQAAVHSMSLEAGPVKEPAPQKVDHEKMEVYARWEVMKALHVKAQNAPPAPLKMRRWPLWAALAITAGASVPNMVEVTTAIKGSGLVAWSLTACFTVVPFLLIMARVGGWAWPVVIGVMAYTCFCNTAAIFGGLTALDSGYILKPTVFLEATTNLLNTDYLNTARVLAFLMSLLVGWIELVSFKKLAQ